MKLKTLTIKELRAKKPADISKYITELLDSKAQLLHDLSTNKDKQTHQLGQIKRSVAQAHTILSETATANVDKKEEKK